MSMSLLLILVKVALKSVSFCKYASFATIVPPSLVNAASKNSANPLL